jgi:hypothetical protein
VVVGALYGGGTVRGHQLLYADPATGTVTAGPVLLRGDNSSFGPGFDFDPSGRYVLYGTQDDHSVSTWWWSGGKPVLVKRIEIGGQVPADVAGAYVGGAW